MGEARGVGGVRGGGKCSGVDGEWVGRKRMEGMGGIRLPWQS